MCVVFRTASRKLFCSLPCLFCPLLLPWTPETPADSWPASLGPGPTPGGPGHFCAQ